jgi:hypothetical protein
MRWSLNSLPEFANVPKKERTRLWRRALRKALDWRYWATMVVVVAAVGALSGAMWATLPLRLTALGLRGPTAGGVVMAASWLLGWGVGLLGFQVTWRRALPHLRAELLAAGRCLGCGYDLTGNASGACPECGAAVPKGDAA